jgi:hypothetical protein
MFQVRWENGLELDYGRESLNSQACLILTNFSDRRTG